MCSQLNNIDYRLVIYLKTDKTVNILCQPLKIPWTPWNLLNEFRSMLGIFENQGVSSESVSA